ncbi:hypothetical protein NGA_0623600 [Nannochloropsis gaditana CCMP526]|uniref:uncharacterized protein n=1 Tax=Nannochloropsis gaditana (strain CCMP526) TaxID=1093141 RepID=UPI00029F4F22|nr:hypothetical protein NGA_0623600 [Nannochloropsis gaditana CCMP526]EKU20774.1 hypothetical protein NGA_0623600 [Nannochloropsis gaditana CCMP526]|eukprot:XP_005855582.1 hypothetical protein NGA_0623600 [Nannochloropsis gaditana CCMP526]
MRPWTWGRRLGEGRTEGAAEGGTAAMSGRRAPQGCTTWWASCSTRAARPRTVITRQNSGRCRRGDGGTWMTRRSEKADMRRC